MFVSCTSDLYKLPLDRRWVIHISPSALDSPDRNQDWGHFKLTSCEKMPQ